MKPYTKQLIAFSGLLTGLLLMGSCKKTETIEPGPTGTTPFTPVTYAKGVTQGAATEKSIDAAGGTLTSPDGKLTLSFPAGALSTATVFAIQPITNTLPLGTGKAYRILPENVVLNKPVTVTLKYDESVTDGSDEDAYDLATQDNTGTWKAMNTTVLDKTNRTLTATTKHLTDFSFTGYYYLVPQKTSLDAGEKTTLIVKKITVDNTANADDESAIGTVTPVTSDSEFEGWEKGGTGTLDASTKTTASYTAPATIDNSMRAEIKATIKNVKRSRNTNGKKVLLRTTLNLQGQFFLNGTYDGIPFTSVGTGAGVGNGLIFVQGATGIGQTIFLIVKGEGIGDYTFGDPGIDGNAEVRCDMQENKVYESLYTWPLCPPPPGHSQTVYATGKVSIKSVTNTSVSGEFSGTIYNDEDCQLKSKLITGTFRARRQ